MLVWLFRKYLYVLHINLLLYNYNAITSCKYLKHIDPVYEKHTIFFFYQPKYSCSSLNILLQQYVVLLWLLQNKYGKIEKWTSKRQGKTDGIVIYIMECLKSNVINDILAMFHFFFTFVCYSFRFIFGNLFFSKNEVLFTFCLSVRLVRFGFKKKFLLRVFF